MDTDIVLRREIQTILQPYFHISENENYEVKWSIIDRAKEFNPDTKKCRLCIKEKYYIIFQPECASLNDRSELFSTCRHRKKKLLANTK